MVMVGSGGPLGVPDDHVSSSRYLKEGDLPRVHTRKLSTIDLCTFRKRDHGPVHANSTIRHGSGLRVYSSDTSFRQTSTIGQGSRSSATKVEETGVEDRSQHTTRL